MRNRSILAGALAYAIALLVAFDLIFWLTVAFAGLVAACAAMVAMIMGLSRLLLGEWGKADGSSPVGGTSRRPHPQARRLEDG